VHLSISWRSARRKLREQQGQVAQRLWRGAPSEPQRRLRIAADRLVRPERGHAHPRAIGQLDEPVGSSAFAAMAYDLK
jgi:hypothetical protein